VLDVGQTEHRLLDDLVRRLAVAGGDAADAAGVVSDVVLVQVVAGADQRSAVEHPGAALSEAINLVNCERVKPLLSGQNGETQGRNAESGVGT